MGSICFGGLIQESLGNGLDVAVKDRRGVNNCYQFFKLSN